MERREHRWARRAVDAWIDAELDDPTAARVAAHVRCCWHCSAAAETARLVKRSLERRRAREPARLSTARMARLARLLADGATS